MISLAKRLSRYVVREDDGTISLTGRRARQFLPNSSRLGDCLRHRSGVPSGLSRFASQAKPLLTIAGELAFISAVVLGAVLI